MNLPAYRAELDFTYAFGRFAVIEALTRRPEDVTLVLWHGAMPPAHQAALTEAAAAAGVPMQRDDATVGRLRRKGNVHCLAQVRKRPEVLAPGNDHVLLLAPSHPGNVGTAIRSLVAFGFEDLALVTPQLDPWGTYVVRASVGLRFALRCQVFATLDAYLADHAQSGARQLYLLDAAGEQELDAVEFRSPFTLLFGPEWRDRTAEASPVPTGPEAAVPAAAGSMPDGLANEPEAGGATLIPTVTVRIPQINRVESLNLATSVSIAAYRARRPPRS